MSDAGSAEPSSAGETAIEECPALKDITVLTYNIAWGGDGGKNLESIQRWITGFGKGFDVIALNECNAMDKNGKLQSFAEASGFSFSVLLRARTGYHLGIMSQRPILVNQTKAHPYHHGLLEVETFGVRFLVTHLSPASSDARLAECMDLSSRISELTVEGVPTILLGDLNTLSPLDKEQHIASHLAQSLAANDRLKKKFLRQGAAGLEIDYRPMQTLLDAGFLDLSLADDSHRPGSTDGARCDLDPEEKGSGSSACTVPTLNHLDPMHAAQMRLDYTLGNAHAHARTACRSVTVRDSRTDVNSDHYPVRAVLAQSLSAGHACARTSTAFVSEHLVLDPAP
eukprot:CAMPEP_0177715546 /NCGR_PEP_ID=MMETSP0484_2-20121128/14052_1 /TAXON_ID=354590 /ORGANISM="Rhodomonas lens, Strain RHODO" /LENGTH=340 /DNA_ID=CAMNT_0019227553 /DNA_START=203 /DNA_END=1225 /DNA_ORIENTATION=+